MIVLKCDICRKELQNPALTLGNMAFCDRCQTHGEEYAQNVTRISIESVMQFQKQVDRFRNQFIRERLNPQLKAVSNASA